jgi:hypothetical protein
MQGKGVTACLAAWVLLLPLQLSAPLNAEAVCYKLVLSISLSSDC